MKDILIFSKDYCPYCKMAEDLLNSKELKYEKFDVGKDEAAYSKMMQYNPSARTVPQIVIDGKSIGGYDELRKIL